MHRDFGKKLKMKWDDIKTMVRGALTAIVWKDLTHDTAIIGPWNEDEFVVACVPRKMKNQG
jgi:hypothetical protein